MDFWSLLKGAGEWLGKNGANGVSNWQNVLGLGGNIYGAYQQQKAAKDALNLQKDAFNWNKMLSQREIDKQNRAQNSLDTAWGMSSYGANKF